MISIKACKNGLMSFNTNDTYIGKSLQEYGEFSESEADLFRGIVKPGMTVLDVGANIGAFSLVFGKLVGQSGFVLAFEPQRLPYYTLCTNMTINELTNVLCMQFAVSNTAGSIYVPELDPRAPNNFGGLSLTDPHEPGGHTVKKVRIDDFNLPNCDFMKVDVEGMEIEVLVGSAETITRCRPVLYVECDRLEKTTELIMAIRKRGYKTLVHAPHLYNPNNFAGNSMNVFSDTVSINIFAYPSEKDCPINPEQFDMQEVARDRTFKITPNPQKSMRVINETEHNIVQGYCAMATAYADDILDLDRSMYYLGKAIEITPDDWRLYNRALPILSRFMKYEEALKYADVAIDKGGNIDVVANKAILLGALDRLEESLECYDQVLEFRPDDPECRFCRSLELLKMGQYKEGWAEYEWRFQRGSQALRELIGFLPDKPKWQGEPLNGKRILLYIEQGAGDQIQFIRYAKMVKERGGHVIAACYAGLQKIVKDIEGVDEVVVHGPDVSLPADFDCDLIQSFMSLPRIFGTDETNIPGEPYIKVRKTKKFSDLDNESAFLIGLSWAGSETHPRDFSRSCELKYFNRLTSLPDVKFVNLQMGSSKRFWQQCGSIDLVAGSDVPMIDVRERIIDFRDTADLLNRLDMVITVDTSLAHMAGAMGKPTWVVLGYNSDWRWGTEGTETPWYPSMRIFRGPNWDTIFTDVQKALEDKLTPVKKPSRTRKS
jgi:FkbM family methyltransferase